jgi:benzoylformate decarboxylase
MEQLDAEGVSRIFGNPGTTELPLIDGLVDYPHISYILCLQEAIAVSMADAYAQTSGEVGVANVHVGPGLGNALGSLYNAYRSGTPMVITAGQQDQRMRLREPVLSHDLVGMAAPLTKWAVEAASADELPHILNRAFKTAREAPSGPVFVSLPINIMSQVTAAAVMRASVVHARTRPDPDGLAAAAAMLARSESPVIICGDGVDNAGAVPALVALAERLGAPVYWEVLPARVNFPNQHPQYRGRMVSDQAAINRRLRDHDAILMVGGRFFEEVWYVDGDPFPPGAKRIQIDDAPSRLGRYYRMDCALLGDIGNALEDLERFLARQLSDSFNAQAEARRAQMAEQHAQAKAGFIARAAEQAGNRPMSTASLMKAMADALPDDVQVASEAITGGLDLVAAMDFRTGADLLSSRGGGIGQGLPTVIGMKLAHPARPALCVTGDGSAMYTIQTLWTAAHHGIPIVALILNNGTYRILKLNMNRFRKVADIDPGRGYANLDINDPPIDFVNMAVGMGLKALRVTSPDEVGPAVARAFASNEPWLIEAVVDGPV